LGVHDLFIGEVLAVQIDEQVLTERGHIDFKKAEPLAYAGGFTGALGNSWGALATGEEDAQVGTAEPRRLQLVQERKRKSPEPLPGELARNFSLGKEKLYRTKAVPRMNVFIPSWLCRRSCLVPC
jgi:hypothetical protein